MTDEITVDQGQDMETKEIGVIFAKKNPEWDRSDVIFMTRKEWTEAEAKANKLLSRRTKKQVVSGYHRPVCGSCHCEMRPEKNGVGLLDMASYGPYEIYDADLWKCPKCGMTVIGGFALGPISAHYKADFKKIVEGYRSRGDLIENSG